MNDTIKQSKAPLTFDASHLQVTKLLAGCGKDFCPSCDKMLDKNEYDEYRIACGTENPIVITGEGKTYFICPTCKAKLQGALLILDEIERRNNELIDFADNDILEGVITLIELNKEISLWKEQIGKVLK
jgi:hypothetical protein